MFVDEVIITVSSGKGGAGAISFRREPFVPRGGPDGGDGGRGGDVLVVATTSSNTLVDYRHVSHLRARDGQPGAPANCTGHGAPPLVLTVPVGTLVRDDQSDELLADLVAEGEEVMVAAGGRGGKGNHAFASSRRRTPRFAQPGEEGSERRLRLELKLLADVAIVGFPSVGKSSLIARISSARPKIAAYHFTTLVPNLGVVERFKDNPFVVADIPGLIEGAHEGRGLGIGFLKHIQRTHLLLHLLDIGNEDPWQDYTLLRRELQAFDPKLLERPEIVAINKCDLLASDQRESVTALLDRFKSKKIPALAISTATGEGIERLVAGLARTVKRLKAAQVEQ